MALATLFVIIAAILFFLAAIGKKSARVSLEWMGAFFLALAHLPMTVVLW